jgi:hypothetical protein
MIIQNLSGKDRLGKLSVLGKFSGEKIQDDLAIALFRFSPIDRDSGLTVLRKLQLPSSWREAGSSPGWHYQAGAW